MADIHQSNNQPRITVSEASDYREGYANSVQVRASVWDFFLSFGTAHQDSPDQVTIRGFQGIYLSPQQAKALFNVLGQNLAQYEQAFGTISLEPVPASSTHRPLN
jgi:flagellar protein FlaG